MCVCRWGGCDNWHTSTPSTLTKVRSDWSSTVIACSGAGVSTQGHQSWFHTQHQGRLCVFCASRVSSSVSVEVVRISSDKNLNMDSLCRVHGYSWDWNFLGSFVFLFFFVIRPPGTTVPDPLMFCMPQMFFSPRFLRDPSTDRPETLPHDWKLAEFYKLTSNILLVFPRPFTISATNQWRDW